MSAQVEAPVKLTKKDFQTDQDVRWCPGCGDYAILATFQKVLPDLGIQQENLAVISGIGCSSRFPYYMNTYGFHTIHGRAPTIATGLKVSRPDLSVWVITGDGDGLSIGGNHLILHSTQRGLKHSLVQQPDLRVDQRAILADLGIREEDQSTPFGSVDEPFKPLMVALGANPSFIARTIDREPKHMSAMFKRAEAFGGTSLIEIYQNCNIFNDGASRV